MGNLNMQRVYFLEISGTQRKSIIEVKQVLSKYEHFAEFLSHFARRASGESPRLWPVAKTVVLRRHAERWRKRSIYLCQENDQIFSYWQGLRGFLMPLTPEPCNLHYRRREYYRCAVETNGTQAAPETIVLRTSSRDFWADVREKRVTRQMTMTTPTKKTRECIWRPPCLFTARW